MPTAVISGHRTRAFRARADRPDRRESCPLVFGEEAPQLGILRQQPADLGFADL
jgi:hypothetical protein